MHQSTIIDVLIYREEAYRGFFLLAVGYVRAVTQLSIGLIWLSELKGQDTTILPKILESSQSVLSGD